MSCEQKVESNNVSWVDRVLLQSSYRSLRGGWFNNGSFNNVGTQGNYWSSTVNNTTNAHNLNFTATGVWPANNNNKGNGLAIRCVAPL
jgi:uncharacterized protein (TIGR02145 family)